MRKSFATVATREGFLTAVDPNVFFQVMLELESFATLRAFKLAEHCILVRTHRRGLTKKKKKLVV